MRQCLARISKFFPGVSSANLIYLIPALILGIALQLQVTFFKAEGYLGLRLNAADLLLPILGIIILWRLITGQDYLPQWRVPHTYVWIFALTALMTFALINGYYTTGTWNTWAIVNKYIGWFVLLAYLGIGGWIGSRPSEEWLPVLKYAVAGFWFFSMAAVLVRLMWIDIQGNTHQILLNYPLSGFMGNRNAYAFLSFSMIALITALQIRRTTGKKWLLYSAWGLVPLFYSYNASRAGLVIMAFLLIAFAFLNLKFTARYVWLPFVIGTLGVFCYFSFFDSYALQITSGHVKNSSQLVELGYLTPEEAKEKLNYVGDKVRMDTYSDALSLWKKHPVMGAGLGAFRDYQTKKRGTFSDIVDCTALWLLAETGLAGLTAFAGFFAFSLWKIFSKVLSGQDPHGIYLGFLFMMIIFAIMSLVHELLYTRFLWFFMGLGLALPAFERKAKTRQDE